MENNGKTMEAEEFLQTIMDIAFEKWTGNIKTFEHFLMTLDPLERDVVVIGKLNQQVCNGGFAQWHYNSYSNSIDFLIHALNNVGTNTAKLVKKLAKDVVREFDEDEDEDDHCIDDRYDDEFYTVGDQLLCDLADYVKSKQQLN